MNNKYNFEQLIIEIGLFDFEPLKKENGHLFLYCVKMSVWACQLP